jgi:hypothetical protein
MLEGKWSKLVWPNSEAAKHEPHTGVDREVLTEVAKASVALPDDFVSALDIFPRLTYSEHPSEAQATCISKTEGTGNQSRFCHRGIYGFWIIDERGI